MGVKRSVRNSRHTRLKPLYPKPHTMYRHILRQAQRLPDPAARYFFLTQARIQFRSSEEHEYTHIGAKMRADRDTLLNTALYHLTRLARANTGSSSDMQYVIGLTYGLIGPLTKERQKYRTILNFKPNNGRLDSTSKYVFDEPIGDNSDQTIMDLIHSHNNTMRYIQSQKLLDDVQLKNDNSMENIPLSEQNTNSLPNQPEELLTTRLLHENTLKNITQHFLASINSPTASYDIDHINHPMTLTPYVFQPFRYGQYFIPQHPFSDEINSIIFRHSTLNPNPLTNPALQQKLSHQKNGILELTDTNKTEKKNIEPLKIKSKNNFETDEIIAYRRENQIFDPDDTHIPLVTRYPTQFPVHPRVQLSFEYQNEPFMHSLLYFLSTQSTFIRSCFRAWTDFGFVPTKQESYDKIFGFNSHILHHINNTQSNYLKNTTPNSNKESLGEQNVNQQMVHIHLPPQLVAKLTTVHQEHMSKQIKH